MVVGKYDGSLKAEHGTGRNMAPFVEAEWGGAAFEIMVRVKSLVDPDGLLNPGVLVNHDPDAHIKDLKSLPEVEEEVDKCIECGFCESLCPSRDLTLTPRQRIVVRRAMERPGADVAVAARGVPVRRARHLRDRRAVRARLPGVDRHRPADQAAARVDGVAVRATARGDCGDALLDDAAPGPDVAARLARWPARCAGSLPVALPRRRVGPCRRPARCRTPARRALPRSCSRPA